MQPLIRTQSSTGTSTQHKSGSTRGTDWRWQHVVTISTADDARKQLQSRFSVCDISSTAKFTRNIKDFFEYLIPLVT